MDAETSSGWSEREQAELSARAQLVRLGFDVADEVDGVRVAGPGFTLRAGSARALLPALLPGERR